MTNKFAYVVIIIIIALLALFAFQNIYKPMQPVAQQEKADVQMETSAELRLGSAWVAPAASIIVQRNTSISNGKRIEIFSLQNSKNTTASTVDLLVIVPKKIAQRAADVNASHAFEILRNDPVFLFNNLQLPEGGIIDRALIVTNTQNIAIIAVLLPADFSRSDSQALLQVTSRYEEFLESLSLQGSGARSADAVSSTLSLLAWQRDFEAMDNFLSNLESSVGPEEQLFSNPVIQPPDPITVSETFPFGSTTLSIPLCPFANQACTGPLVRLRGSAADYSQLELAQAEDGKIKANIAVDFTSASEALQSAEEGQQIAEIELEIAYPMAIGLEPQIVKVPVEYSRDAGIEFDAVRQTQLVSFETSGEESELQLPIDRSTVSRFSPFGQRRFADGTTQFHSGVDFEAPTGTQVVSPADCRVSNLRRDCRTKRQCRCGNGVHLTCLLSDGKSYEVKMCHLSSISVAREQLIAKGQEIGKVGRSGMADGPHLHYEIIDQYTGRNIDPAAFHARHGSRLITIASR